MKKKTKSSAAAALVEFGSAHRCWRWWQVIRKEAVDRRALPETGQWRQDLPAPMDRHRRGRPLGLHRRQLRRHYFDPGRLPFLWQNWCCHYCCCRCSRLRNSRPFHSRWASRRRSNSFALPCGSLKVTTQTDSLRRHTLPLFRSPCISWFQSINTHTHTAAAGATISQPPQSSTWRAEKSIQELLYKIPPSLTHSLGCTLH